MIKTENSVEKKFVETSMSYVEYRTMLDDLLKENKTTGGNQSEQYIHYAKLNQARMERIEKNLVIGDELKSELNRLNQSYFLLTLAEGWCGDAAQNIPAIQKMAEASLCLELRILLRDENPELMDRYLTNGSRSIPKVLVLEKNSLAVIAEWGPRPLPAQQIMLEMKAKHAPSEEKSKAIHLWYAMDKSVTLQNEFTVIFSQLEK